MAAVCELSTCCVLGGVLCVRDTAVIKTTLPLSFEGSQPVRRGAIGTLGSFCPV